MQEVVDATLLEKVETSIERNKSLQLLFICVKHYDVIGAILKGARGSTSFNEVAHTACFRGTFLS